MTWAGPRTIGNNVSFLKQESIMGIGANAPARIEREHSVASEKVLRNELSLRERRKKELEFHEKGGNPLDLEYTDATVTLLSDTEGKEKKFIVIHGKYYNNGLKKNLDGYGRGRKPGIVRVPSNIQESRTEYAQELQLSDVPDLAGGRQGVEIEKPVEPGLPGEEGEKPVLPSGLTEEKQVEKSDLPDQQLELPCENLTGEPRLPLSGETLGVTVNSHGENSDLPRSEDSDIPLPNEISALPLSDESSGLTLPGKSLGLPLPGGSSGVALPGESSSLPLPGEGLPLPGDSSGLPLPAENSVLPLPGESSGLSLPGESSGLPLPGESSGLPLPGESSGLPLPGGSSGLPLPGESSGLPLPGGSSGLPLPGESSGLPLPGESSGLPLPDGSSGLTLPGQTSALQLPDGNSAVTLPGENGEKSGKKTDLPGNIPEIKNESAEASKSILPSMSEDDILEAARIIQETRELAARKPHPGPMRRKSHWDFVLEEMAWMANDFMQERLWKMHAAARTCRCATEASFWAKAKERHDMKYMDIDNNKESSKLENYAFRFLESVEPDDRPCTPEVKERPVKNLHFIIPHGAAEALRLAVGQKWASKAANYTRELQRRNESAAEEEALQNLKKRNRETQDEDFSEFDTGAKKPRTFPGPGRPPKKKGRPSNSQNLNKGTDSENEWMPEVSIPDKTKRKKDQLLGIKSKDDLPSTSKMVKLSKSVFSKKSSLRKGDLFQVSINQPGNGVPWTSVEDQAILIVCAEFGTNWDLNSDIFNAGSHIRGHFRSSKECKERCELLCEKLQIDIGSGDVPGIPKGTGLMLLQRMLGPMEEDTVRFHFEKIMKAKLERAPMRLDYPVDRAQPHECQAEITSQIKNAHGRFLSPLDFYEPTPQKSLPANKANIPVNKEVKPLPSNVARPPVDAPELKDTSTKVARKTQKQVKQAPVKDEKAHILQPNMPQMNYSHANIAQTNVSQKQRNNNSEAPKMNPTQAAGYSGHKKPVPLPPCSTSHQDHQEQHQHTFRMGMQPNYYGQHRCAGRYTAPVTQWRPAAQSLFTQMTCMNQVPPSSDAVHHVPPRGTGDVFHQMPPRGAADYPVPPRGTLATASGEHQVQPRGTAPPRMPAESQPRSKKGKTVPQPTVPYGPVRYQAYGVPQPGYVFPARTTWQQPTLTATERQTAMTPNTSEESKPTVAK